MAILEGDVVPGSAVRLERGADGGLVFAAGEGAAKRVAAQGAER